MMETPGTLKSKNFSFPQYEKLVAFRENTKSELIIENKNWTKRLSRI
jgi:hypothetical protein